MSDVRRHIAIAAGCVVFFVALVYSPSLENTFVNWDDDAHLLNNPFVQSLDGEGLRDMLTTTVNKIYIPLTALSFAIEYHFFKDHPFIYHLDNLLLHLSVTVMVLLFALRCGLSLRAAFLSALVFGVHPLHVESVAWVSERKDVLYAFFYMLALICYSQYLTPRGVPDGMTRRGIPKPWLFVLTMVFGFLSILAKPMAISLPLVLLVCDWFFRRKFSRRALVEKAYCCIFMIPIAWVTYFPSARAFDFQFPQSFLVWVWSLTFYIRKFFYPDYFVLIYEVPRSPLPNPQYLIVLILCAGLLTGTVLLRKNRLFVFAVLFYTASTFFLWRLDQRADINMAADRFMYLGMTGWCLWLGAGYDHLLIKFHGKRIQMLFLLCAGLAALGILSFKTVQQSRVWYDGVSLWGHQLKYQGNVAHALVYNKLAQAHTLRGDFKDNPQMLEQILRYYDQAIRIKPDDDNVYFNLGDLYLRLENSAMAKVYFEKAVAFDPRHFEAYYQLGLLYHREGRYREAEEVFAKAVRVYPDAQRMRRRIADFYTTPGKTIDTETRK